MKRFFILFSALVLAIPVTGCGEGSGGTTTPVPRAEDTHLPKEVREWEAKNAKRLADQAEKAALKKAGKSRSKTR
jgi:hypothetical protein